VKKRLRTTEIFTFSQYKTQFAHVKSDINCTKRMLHCGITATEQSYLTPFYVHKNQYATRSNQRSEI